MAMIRCSECGREISDQAKSCPGCGAVTYAGRRDEEQKNQDMAQAITAVILLAFLIAGAVLLFIGTRDFVSDMGNGWYNYKAPLTKHEQDVLYKLIGGAVLVGAYIGGTIKLRKKTGHSGKYKTEWRPMNLGAGGSAAMWVCPDCSTRNKESSYTCDKCGYRRI